MIGFYAGLISVALSYALTYISEEALDAFVRGEPAPEVAAPEAGKPEAGDSSATA